MMYWGFYLWLISWTTQLSFTLYIFFVSIDVSPEVDDDKSGTDATVEASVDSTTDAVDDRDASTRL